MPNQFNSPEGDLENYFVSEYWLIDQYVGDQLWGWGASLGGRIGNNSSAILTNGCTPTTTLAGGSNWKQISCSNTGSVAIKTDGSLWIWGNNLDGQLGDNSLIVKCTPVTTFVGGNNWKQCSSGTFSTAAIKTDGTLWTWGAGSSGELGNNFIGANRCTPVTTFVGGNNWKQVSCGSQYMAAIKNDGTLWTWGNNSDGQLGINLQGATAFRSTPVTTFLGGTNWKQVSCGVINTVIGANPVGVSSVTCTAAIKTDGTLWTWGGNMFGQLGINVVSAGTLIKCTPVTTFVGGTNWKQVSCGGWTMGAIKTDGTLWAWGVNTSGQLGVNDTVVSVRCTPVTTFVGGTNWKQVSCGLGIMAAIKTDGSLWNWGINTSGEMGIADMSATSFKCTPVTTFLGGTNWKQVDCGVNHTMAITSGTDPTSFVS